jgi:hypothetical protein
MKSQLRRKRILYSMPQYAQRPGWQKKRPRARRGVRPIAHLKGLGLVFVTSGNPHCPRAAPIALAALGLPSSSALKV